MHHLSLQLAHEHRDELARYAAQTRLARNGRRGTPTLRFVRRLLAA